MDRLRQGNIIYMETKDYELQIHFGKPQPPQLTRIIKSVDTILSKVLVTNSDRMEVDALTRRYEEIRTLSIVRGSNEKEMESSKM